MRRLTTIAVAAAIAIAAPTVAQAVDLVNEDETDHTVMIEENGEESGITVSAGETITDVCNSCTLSVGDNEPVEAQGDEAVIVRNGVLTKRSG